MNDFSPTGHRPQVPFSCLMLLSMYATMPLVIIQQRQKCRHIHSKAAVHRAGMAKLRLLNHPLVRPSASSSSTRMHCLCRQLHLVTREIRLELLALSSYSIPLASIIITRASVGPSSGRTTFFVMSCMMPAWAAPTPACKGLAVSNVASGFLALRISSCFCLRAAPFCEGTPTCHLAASLAIWYCLDADAAT